MMSVAVSHFLSFDFLLHLAAACLAALSSEEIEEELDDGDDDKGLGENVAEYDALGDGEAAEDTCQRTATTTTFLLPFPWRSCRGLPDRSLQSDQGSSQVCAEGLSGNSTLPVLEICAQEAFVIILANQGKMGGEPSREEGVPRAAGS